MGQLSSTTSTPGYSVRVYDYVGTGTFRIVCTTFKKGNLPQIVCHKFFGSPRDGVAKQQLKMHIVLATPKAAAKAAEASEAAEAAEIIV